MSTVAWQIPLQAQAPAVPNVLDQFSKMQALKNLGVQNQLQQQQLQTGAMENQQLQMQMDQTKALNESYSSAVSQKDDGSFDIDEGKLTNALSQSGHGSAIPGVMKGIIDYKKSATEYRDALGKVKEQQDNVGGKIGAAVKSAGYDPNLLLTMIKNEMQNKTIDANAGAQFMTQMQQAYQQDPSGQTAKQLSQRIADQLIVRSPEQRKLANETMTATGAQQRGNAAELTANTAAAEKSKQDAAGQLSLAPDAASYKQILDNLPRKIANLFPDESKFDPASTPNQVRQIGMTPYQQAELNKPVGVSESAANREAYAGTMFPGKKFAQLQPPEQKQVLDKIAKDQTAGKISVSIQTAAEKQKADQAAITATPGDATKTGEDYLKSLPYGFRNQVKQIALGGIKLPPMGMRGVSAPLRNAVMQYDPDMTEQRAEVRSKFTTGADGRNIGNLNTATVHMDQLGEIAKAMDNGTFQPGNDIWNKAKTMFGGEMPTNYEGLRQAVAGEMDQALHQTSTIEGRKAIADTMPAKNTPGQMTGIVNTNLKTLGAKLNTYKERYEQQIPNDTVWNPILPSARGVFDKHGLQPTSSASGGGGAAPAGKIAVISPEGVPGFIDAGKWNAAQSRGFKKQ